MTHNLSMITYNCFEKDNIVAIVVIVLHIYQILFCSTMGKKQEWPIILNDSLEKLDVISQKSGIH